MKSRLFRSDDGDRKHRHERSFDPIVEGNRYQLSAAVSLAIWERVYRESIGSSWQRDDEGVRQQFHHVAAYVAAHGGSLAPDPGRLTRHDLEPFCVDPTTDAFANPVPGKTTQVLMEERRWERRTRDTRPTSHQPSTSGAGNQDTRAQELASEVIGNHPLTAERAHRHRLGTMALRSPEMAGPSESPDDNLGEVATPLELALHYSRGIQLVTEVRHLMEQLFGQSFDDVQIHVDNGASTAATAINARAFTIANHIFFREAAYASETPAGLELLAHELSHVVQWRQGRVPQAAGAHQVSHPSSSLEQEASTVGRDIASRARALARSDDRAAASTPSRATATRPAIHRPSIDLFRGMVLRDGPRNPHASVDTIPTGGTPIDKVGIVAWDGSPTLRLRSSASTAEDNIISQLGFNTHLQVIREFPGKWYFVSTEQGQLGYVAKDYIKTNLPEPNAKLHRVESGLPGFAISIAEQYYKRWANDWGQDLRFYVNVLAWVNRRPVPDTTSGWRNVQFKAGELIWVPTHEFARSLRGIVNSGSRSHNIADAIGIADFLDRVGELWDDIRAAIALSKKYIPEAIGRHVEAALCSILESLAMMLVLAVAFLAISTAIGAAVGALAGGIGAAPGAAAGFEIGMVLLNWLGLGMLVVWIGQSVIKVAGAFGDFLSGVWNARGDERKLDRAARLFAEAIGTLCGVLLEGLVMWAVSIGATKALGALRGTRFGAKFNNSKTGEWLNERVRRVKAGEAPLPTPKDVLGRLIREVELVDAKNSPVGEFDAVDVAGKRFIENKSATGIDKPNPRTGKPAQTAADWAAKQIAKKTLVRIKALASAAATRGKGGKPVPSIGEIKGFRHIHFMIDGESPALRAAVFAELANLRTTNPGWTFTAEFGVKIFLPPVPGAGSKDE